MSENDSQERTLAPTDKRKREAREKGQIPRSRDLSKTLLLVVAAILLWLSGGSIISVLSMMMKQGFLIQHDNIVNFSTNVDKWQMLFVKLLMSLMPFFIGLFLCALLAPLLTGGWVFSTQLIGFKGSRLNPLSGITKMFSLMSVVELIKAIIKIALLLGGGVILLYTKFNTILSLNRMPREVAFTQSAYLFAYAFIILTAILIVLIFIDVPFQIWQSAKKLKMTSQEAKQESRESEGSPEMKGRIRFLQQKLAKQRMMIDVPTADVVVTNPTHYAVALRYEQEHAIAPKVVAKGGGVVAEQIRKLAKENKVAILSAPPLARALYFSTDVGREIPGSLYVAVAKVLAYVYQLKHFNVLSGNMPAPLKVDDLPIPDDLRY